MANEYTDERIVDACREGDIDTLRGWMESCCQAPAQSEEWSKLRPWTDAESRSFESPLVFVAIDYQQVDVVEALLDHFKEPAFLNVLDADDYTPLQWASNAGALDVVRLLMERGAKVDQDALDYAKEEGHTEIVQLLKGQVDLYSTLNGDIDEIMIKASRMGDVEKVQELIAQGYDFEKWRDEDGSYQEYSPIYVAMKNGHIELIREFLQAGVEAELHSTHFNHDVENTTPPPPAELTQEQIDAFTQQMLEEDEKEEAEPSS